MTKHVVSSPAFSAPHSASCSATFAAGTSALVIILGIACAVSIIICSIIGIVRLLSLVVLISLLVGNAPSRLRTAAQ